MRTISVSFRNEIEATNGVDVVVMMATITHPALDGPICVNSDVADYNYNGVVYYGVGFDLSFVSDDDNPPQAKVSIENVDRRLGEALLGISEAPRIMLQLVRKSDFDESNPRNAIDTPTVEYTAPLMFLRNEQWDAQTVSADLASYDISTEPWPAIRTTPSTTPALFR